MKENDESDIAKMTPQQRADRTYKKHVYSCLLSLYRAIEDAKKAGVDIGNVADLDCRQYFDAVRIAEKYTVESTAKYMGR